LIPHLKKRLAKRRVEHKGMLLSPAMTRQ